MHKYSLFALAIASAALVSGCKTIETARVVYPDTPIAYQLVSDMVDEETIEHSVKFRNIGKEVISFDYTITDDPTVPHIDCLGPNSGLIENLYPGAEILVKNPTKPTELVGPVPGVLSGKRGSVHMVLGRITYGKRTSDELARSYKPSTVKETNAGLDLAAESLLGDS